MRISFVSSAEHNNSCYKADTFSRLMKRPNGLKPIALEAVQ